MPTFKKTKWLPLLIVLLIFAMALTACGGDDDDDGDNDDNGDNTSDNADNGGDNGGSDDGGGSVTAELATGTVTVSVPDGWVTDSGDGSNFWLASSDEVLAKTDRDNTEAVESGEIAALVVPSPSGGASPMDFYTGFSASGNLPFEFTGDPEEVTIGSISGVRAPAGTPLAEGWAYIMAVDDANVLIVIGMTAPDGYDDDVDSIIRGIIESAEVTGPSLPEGDG